MKSFNLDDESEVRAFIETYGTTNGICLAHLLGITGKGSKKRANALSGYAWNKWTAICQRKLGKVSNALMYEGICDRIYERMDSSNKW